MSRHFVYHLEHLARYVYCGAAKVQFSSPDLSDTNCAECLRVYDVEHTNQNHGAMTNAQD